MKAISTAWLPVLCLGALVALPVAGATRRLDAAAAVGAVPGSRSDATPPQPNPPASGDAGGPLRVISEGFEQVGTIGGGLYASGWIRQNNSEAPWSIWFRGRADIFAAMDGPGDSYIVQNWYATSADSGAMSSWLLTPPINFGADTTLSFYTRTSQGAQQADRLQVRACASGDCTDVGTRPADVGAFGQVVLDINPDERVGVYPESWTRYTLSAADGLPTSGTGRLAFRYVLHQDDGVLRGNYIGIDRVVVEQSADPPGPLDLAVTVSRADASDPQACGSATAIDVAVGDQVNLCYRATNRSSAPLRYHSLRDDQSGTVFNLKAQDVAPGATYQYNRIVTVSHAQSPSATWMAQADPPGYRYDDSQPANFIDITDGDVVLPDGMATFPADFDFKLYGERLDRICVAHYGIVASPKGPWCPSYGMHIPVGYPQPLPETQLSIVGSSLGLYWTMFADDGYEAPTGTIFQKTIGTAPNRRYIVEFYRQTVTFGSPLLERGLTAEVILHEGSNVVEFQYDNVVFGGTPTLSYGGNASIGLQRYDQGQQYSFRTQSLRNVNRIVWTPSDRTVHTQTRKVRIGVQTPALTLDATAINVAAPSGGHARQVLDIANGGDGRLDWTAGASATNRHMPATPRYIPPVQSGTTPAFGVRAERKNSASAPSGATLPAAPTARPLWSFDTLGGYLVATDSVTPGYDGSATIKGYTGTRTISGADFLDDDFSVLYAFDADHLQLLRYTPIDANSSAVAVERVVGTVNGLPPGSLASGFKQDPTTGAVYMASADGHASRLWRIDPRTAGLWPVGGSDGAPGLISIDFDDDGNLFGVDVVQHALVAIDKASGEARAIGSLGFDTGGMFSALAFDPADGKLYLAANVQSDGAFPAGSALFTVDPGTGAATWVAPIAGMSNDTVQFSAMAFAHRGVVCTQAADIPWLSLGSGGGSIAPGAPAVALSLDFDASGLSDGVYAANLCIHSNDPLHLRAALPISFSVGHADRVFADGFDGAHP